MANPDKPVVVITGDGSLGFYIAELDTAVRHNLPIVSSSEMTRVGASSASCRDAIVPWAVNSVPPAMTS